MASPPLDSTPIPATRPGVPLDSTSVGVPAAPVRWKPFAIGGAIFVLLVILIGATRGGSNSGSTRTTTGGPTMSGIGPTMPPPDEPIQIAEPPMPGGKAAKDWRKVIDHIERGNFSEARKKLGEWERKYGSSPETESLRTQLENRADVDDERGPPGHRGPHDD